MRPFFHVSFGAALLVAVAAAPAAGQARAERPYRGLFASGTDGLGKTLAVTGSASAGYDKLTDFRAIDAGGGTRGAFMQQGSAGLSYALRGETVTTLFDAGSSVRRYRREDTSLLQSHSASASVEIQPSTKTSFGFFGAGGYQPYSYAAALLGLSSGPVGLTPSADLGLSSTVEHYVSLNAGANVERQVSRRTRLAGNYSYRFTNASANRPAYAYQTVAGRLTYSIGRGLAARVGYGYSENAARGSSAGVPLHNLDLGIDFNRSLSFSRRTTLSFSTGSTAVTVDGQTQFGVIGSANLVREIGRTWSASVQYGRTAQVIDTWQQPLFSDALSAEFGGLMSRRLDFHSSVRGSLGHVGLGTAASSRVENYSGAAGLGYAFNRSLKLGADYLYYRYDMGQAAAVLPQAPSRLNQQSARVTLSVWAPVITRTRRGDASR